MSRAPFQVLVFPYRIIPNGDILYVVFKRESSTGGYWQGIAGGGEDGESPLQTAKREVYEEAGIQPDSEFIRLDSMAMIPVVDVCGFKWGKDVLVIPQYCFGVKVEDDQLQLSNEHTEYKWMDYDGASKVLHWENNKNALWELDYRIRKRLQEIQ